MENSVKNLIQFIDHSPSCFHVIENAKRHHVGRMLIVCTNFKEFERAKSLKKQHPAIFDIALGFHPNDLYKFEEKDRVIRGKHKW